MSEPREILPGRYYEITRRCTQRLFILRPDDETNNAILYCLAEAAARYEIRIILPSVLSNHHHTVIYDHFGRVIEFVEHFHKMVAKCMNVLRGRTENMWSSDPPSIVELVDDQDVIEKVIYAATNPVKDGLVENIASWPGLNGFNALVNGRVLHAKRPWFFFRSDGPMPAEVTLEIGFPAHFAQVDAVIEVLRERVAAFEEDHRIARAQSGRRVLGRRAVLRQSWMASPSTAEARREIRPRVAAQNKCARIDKLRRNRDFVVRYRLARAAWLAGTPIPFPPGTYWLRRFVGVPVEAVPLN